MNLRDKTFCHVYLITNLVNNKWYVGKTEYSVEKRWKDHLEEARKSRSTLPLYRAMRRYGAENFVVDTVAQVSTVKEANNLETLWITLLGSHQREFGYNMTYGGEGAKHNEEAKKRMSLSQKGRPLSPEHRKALCVPKAVPSFRKGTEVRSDIPTPELIRLYSLGLSCASIASRFFTTRETVRWRLRKSGVTMKPPGFQKQFKEQQNVQC